MGSTREPLDLVDIRKEQRRCAALLKYAGPPGPLYGRRAGLSNLQIKPRSNRVVSDNTKHVPFNALATPWRRAQTSDRSQHTNFGDDLHLTRQQDLSAKSGVNHSFYDASRKVLEKLQTQRTLCKDCNRIGGIDSQLEEGRERKLRRHVSIVTIADQTRISTGVEGRVCSRQDSVAWQRYGLSLRLEPTPHGREFDEGHGQDNSLGQTMREKSGTDNRLLPVLSVNSQSVKSEWQSSGSNATHEVTGTLHRNPSVLKRKQSILRRDSYSAALMQARRRLIHKGLPFGSHVTREFTYSYYTKCENGTSVFPHRKRGRTKPM